MVEKIVFIAAYNYLAFPHYKALAPEFTYQETIYFHLNDLVSDTYEFDIEKAAPELLHYFNRVFTIEYPKLHFDKTDNFLENSINWIKTKINLFTYSRNIKRSYDKVNPSAIISVSDMSFIDRVSMQWCETRNKPFFILQPSFIDSKLIFRRPDEIVNRNIPKYSHKIKIIEFAFIKLMKLVAKFERIVLPELLKTPYYAKQQFYGYESNKTHLMLWSKKFLYYYKRPNIHYGGNPSFDKFFKAYQRDKQLTGRVLICTEDIDEFLGADIFNEIIEIYDFLFKNIQDKHFIIKVHPRESKEKYERLFPPERFTNVTILKNRLLFDLFKEVDMQISINSYTTMEAAAFGIPVITLTPQLVFDNIIDYYEEKINIRAFDKESLVFAVNKAYTPDFRNKFIHMREDYFKEMFSIIDGTSSKMIAEMIVKYAKDP